MKYFARVSLQIFFLLTSSVIASNQTVIKGKIKNHSNFPENKNVFIIFMEYASGQQNIFTSEINDLGEFEIKADLDFAHDGYLNYAERLSTIYLEPNSNLTINFDAEKYINSEKGNLQSHLNFEGKLKEVNQNISDYLVSYNNNFPSPYEKHLKLKDLSLQEYVKYRYKLFEDEKIFNKEFISQNKVSPIFVEWSKYEIMYSCADELMRYRWEHDYANAKLKNLNEKLVSNPEGYIDFLDKFIINNPKAMISTKYHEYLHECDMYIVGKKMNLEKSYWTAFIIKIKNLFNSELDNKIKYVIKNYIESFDGIARDITISNYMFSIMGSQPDLDILKQQVNYYNENVENEILKSSVNKRYNEIVELISGSKLTSKMELKENENSGNKFLSELIKQNEGKVIYIDFWAPWCSPCRNEMKFSKELKNSFDDTKISFVYLCNRAPDKQWKEGIATLGIEGQHYLLTDDQWGFLSAEYNISGIPRYMIIDKTGKIIDKYAKQPSLNEELNQNLIAQLEDLIEK
ncbi:MAG: TlpA family protein disulfide reductase [Ignavibacteriales bacterium]|nr:TlpA family protein disulfide reductase [Ignavibacteriales bacterium]